ncbi:MAG: hypothetical protein IJF32_11245 [Oscillospiraceae bacterium]|nr:hypothetical protein [Oscillospiraceae bacterium]
MKKLLSIILAAAMMLSLIPSVFASGEEFELTFGEGGINTFVKGKSNRHSVQITNNRVEFLDARTDTYAGNNVSTHTMYVALPFTAKNTGTYEIQLKTDNPTDTSADVSIFIVEDTGTSRCGNRADHAKNLEGEQTQLDATEGTMACYFLGCGMNQSDTNTKGDDYSTEYEYGWRGRFNFSKAKKDTYAPVINGSKAATTELVSGKSYYFILYCDDESAEFVTETYLTETSTKLRQHFFLSGIKFVPVEAAATPETVSFIVSDVEGVTAKIGSADVEKGKAQSAGYGKTLSLSAVNTADKIFRYWKSGSADNGSYYSNLANIEVPLVSNMTFTAIYEDVVATSGKSVQFFNQNKAFIDEKTTSGTTLPKSDFPTATLKGFSDFLGWYKSTEDLEAGNKFTEDTELTDDVTRVVAQFAETGKTLSNTLRVSGTAKDSVAYAEAVECTGDDKTTAWKRDGRVVSYGKDYTYFAWDIDTDITSSDRSCDEVTPIIVLDKNSSGEYMIEYDKNGYTVLEAGILFGSDKSTVDSYLSKAKVSELSDHGQFMAAPNGNEGALYTGARGYLVYEDNGEKKIIYANTYMD